MENLESILKKLRKSKNRLAKSYHIKEIGIFGSYAKKTAGKKSDVDIIVEFSKVPGLEFMGLEIELGKILGKKVDLVRKKSIRKELRKSILDRVVYV